MFTINCRGRLVIWDKPIVMGIINITPDSFYSGNRMQQTDQVQQRAHRMLEDGATIIDIGGQSTRPGSTRVSEEVELQRVLPAIAAINKQFPEALISIDTFYAKVARLAIQHGAHIVNDVSDGGIDEQLLPTVADLGVPYILMHIKGTPQTMHQQAVYEHVVTEVFDQLNQRMHQLQQMGIKDIIVDPGFGFSKNSTHNFELLRHLNYLSQLQAPLLVGLSRKATIYKPLGITAEEALNGSTVMHTIALLNGATILRVHDVKEAMEAITLVEAYRA